MPPVADHFDRHARTYGLVGDEIGQRLVGCHIATIDLDDNIALLDAGLVGRLTGFHSGNQFAVILFDTQRIGNALVERLDPDTQITARDLGPALQLFDNRKCLFGGNGETDPDIAARGRKDHRVDADDIAVDIEHRAARIALVDRGIGLDIAIIGAALPGHAVERRDDARGHGAAKPERIADRNHPVTDPCLGRIAEFHEGQVGGVDLENRKVRGRIAADELRVIFDAIGHDHLDRADDGRARPFAARNDMIVRHDIAVGRNDEAGAERLRFTRDRTAAIDVAAAEQIAKRRAGERV